MEPETLREYVSENRELESQLTKRNQQYIFDLKKAMDAANLSEEEKTVALHEMLPTLVAEQKGGKTARQLFGTVSEAIEQILTEPEIEASTNPFLMWADNSLLILGVFGIMLGIMGLFSKNSGQVYGVITLFLMSAMGGWVFYLMYKYMYKYEQPGADRSQKPKLWQTILVLVGAFGIWMFIIGASSMIPTTINVILPPIVTIIISAAAIGLRQVLKKRYNIASSLATPRAK